MAAYPVLVIQTGGTIDKIYPNHPGAYGFTISCAVTPQIIGRISPNYPLRTVQVCQKDSQDITVSDRDAICDAILSAKEEHIVVTHGTDTMIETGVYLERKLTKAIDKIVVLLGAFQPWCVKNTDAEFNVGMALGFFAQCSTQRKYGTGVFICMNGFILPANNIIRNKDGKFIPKAK